MKRTNDEQDYEENDPKKVKNEKHWSEMSVEELINEANIHEGNILSQIHIISVQLFGREPTFTISRNEYQKFNCELLIEKGEFWDPPTIITYGYGNNEKKARENASFEAIYDLLSIFSI